jgi:hypothetical protein
MTIYSVPGQGQKQGPGWVGYSAAIDYEVEISVVGVEGGNCHGVKIVVP